MVLCKVILEGWNGRKVGDGVMLSDDEAYPLIEKGILETADGSEIKLPHNFMFTGTTTRR